MRKFGLLLIPLLFWGCDKTFENVIDVARENYQVTTVTGIKDTIDLKNPSDSLLNLRLIFTPESEVNHVYFDVIDPDDSPLNSSPIEMINTTDVIYEKQFVMISDYINGNYRVQFSVTGFDGVNKVVAVSGFNFNNGQDNVAPVISNLVIPDTISKGVFFNYSITVTDSNGLNDIRKEDGVFFNLYRPDSTIVQASPFYMHDDGDVGFGDEVAGDGIFSFRNSFLQDTTTQVGNWRFVFQAIDRSNSLSNIIEHLMLVQ